ncbi:two-component sensor histidine kinase [Thalassococcus sp. CAU 1522]|uniref:histidine kinase n=1 Tax=Thalassococcus arenae TaxID=2851652 RepID=A0ABS6NAF1_9RHOB|nr:ATP-binding protein [Thalassococcus arenae]MBV2360948.1 two-component sensor histidine kinase [Thalassococcus arenae]
MQAAAEALIAGFPLPAVLIRADERIAAANEPATALLGPGMVGRHFITALRQPTLLDAIEDCLQSGEPRKTDYLTNDGRQDTTFRVSIAAVALDRGRGVLVTFEDITHLEQAGQMRRDFVANVSHELRTPLTALIGFIETLKGPARNDEVARDRFLDTMEKEAGRMNRLVQDLLSLSRVEAEERVRPTGRVDPAALIRTTLDRLSPMAMEAGVRVLADLPDSAATITGDADQLVQVVTNLVENAIKYSGRGAEVHVSLSRPVFEPRIRGDGIRITVRDTGPGIDAIHLPRLTERFYRIDTHRSREKGGTGLGLAIVKHIVNRHRGRLRVESEPGKGATFIVILPIT